MNKVLYQTLSWSVALALVCVLGVGLWRPLFAAATIIVNSTADSAIAGDGHCTLREAILNANANGDLTAGDCVTGSSVDQITFGVPGGSSIILTSGLPDISDSLRIDGGGGNRVTINGNHGGFGVLRVIVPAVGLSVSNLIIADGSSHRGGGIYSVGPLGIYDSSFTGNQARSYGGAIYHRGADLTIVNSSFALNHAGFDGGAIYVENGTVVIDQSAFTGNSALNFGGALFHWDGSLMVRNSTFNDNVAYVGGALFIHYSTMIVNSTIMNSTLTRNVATSYGGAVFNAGGALTVIHSTLVGNYSGFYALFQATVRSLTLRNSIVANNGGSDNCSDGITDGGGNISYGDASCPGDYVDPQFDPAGLQDNGGATQTIAFQPSSPAVNHVTPGACLDANNAPLAFDQRGLPRPSGGACDSGAYELQLAPLPPVAGDDAYTTNQDTPLIVDAPGILGNDSASDPNAVLSTLLTTSPHGALTLNRNGSFTYTPPPRFSGTDSFTYWATDGVASSVPATVHITVNQVFHPPVATADFFTTTIGVPISGNVLTNDYDPDGDPLTTSEHTDPSHGVLSFEPNGAFSYQPAPNYVGEDSFTYGASARERNGMGGLSNIVTVTLTVKATQPVITIAVDAQPDSITNFRFDGTLGLFRLDDSLPDDGDAYTQTKTFVVAPGNYIITEQQLSAWPLLSITCTPGAEGAIDPVNGGVTIPVTMGANVTCTFTHQRAGKLTAYKYNDLNQNHERSADEPYLSGWEMQLFTSPSMQVASQNTDRSGRATFLDLRPGAYTVCEVMQPGWFNITPSFWHLAYQKPCYTVTIAPDQAVSVRFGNSTTPLVAAAEAGEFGNVIVMDLPDTDDDGNEVTPLPHPWPDVVEEQIHALFLPLVTR